MVWVKGGEAMEDDAMLSLLRQGRDEGMVERDWAQARYQPERLPQDGHNEMKKRDICSCICPAFDAAQVASATRASPTV